MLKQICFYALSLSFACCLDGAVNSSKPKSSTEEKYEIMHLDQMNSTDTLAIPFDDSEVEDEEQINLDEHKQVFRLPQTPAKSAK